MDPINIFILGASFVIQLLTLLIGWFKLIKPQADATAQQIQTLTSIAAGINALIANNAIMMERQQKGIKDLESLNEKLADKSNFCSWVNAQNADHLADKIAKEVMRSEKN